MIDLFTQQGEFLFQLPEERGDGFRFDFIQVTLRGEIRKGMESLQSVPAISVDDRLAFGTEARLVNVIAVSRSASRTAAPGVPQLFHVADDIEHELSAATPGSKLPPPSTKLASPENSANVGDRAG